MRSLMPLRGGVVIALASLAAFSAYLAPAAGQSPPAIIRYTATAVGLSVGNGEALRIELMRASTDQERKTFVEKVVGQPQEFVTALGAAPSLGYIFTTSEGVGYTIRYAARVSLPDGGERVIVATDRRLGSWAGREWKAVQPRGVAEPPYTLIELRLDARGDGEGKMSLSAPVIAETANNTLALGNYAAAPVVLKPARRQPAYGTSR